MTAFDYALFFILGCSLVMGGMRGFMREILSLAGWLVAFIAANMYGEAFAGMLPDMIPGETLRLIASFIIIFVVARIAMIFLAKALDVLVTAGGLSGLNRILGALFGIARGIMISVLVVLLCGLTALPQQPFWKYARFSRQAEQAAKMALPYLPDSMAKNIKY